jgi:hypothetical protein
MGAKGIFFFAKAVENADFPLTDRANFATIILWLRGIFLSAS